MEIKIPSLPRHPRDVLNSLAAIEWKLPRKPREIAVAAAAGLVLIVSLICVFTALHTSRATNVEYFTIDDGRTYFSLSGAHFAPFQYDGHEAVKAILFQGSDGKPFVGYLMKYTPGAQQAMASAAGQNASSTSPEPAAISENDQLVKRPGDKEWLPTGNPMAPDVWGTATDPKTKAEVTRWQPH
jgi:hypothetical protein